MNQLNKTLGGPGNATICGIHHCANVYNVANDKMLVKTLLQALPLICLWHCFQYIKSLCYRLMPFQNRLIIQT